MIRLVKKMKQKKKMILFCVLCFLSFVITANAECDYETQVQLMTYAYNVNANYETKTIVVDENENEIVGMDPSEIPEEEMGQDSKYGLMSAIELEIRNITDSIYVVVKEKNLGIETFTITYADTTDGTYTYRIPDTNNIRNYEITVYAENQDCYGTELNKFSVVSPKKNSYHDSTACLYLTDKYYCQEYVTSDVNVSDEEIGQELQKYFEEGKKKEEGQEQSEENFWEKYQTFIIIGASVVLLIGVGVAVVLIIRKRRKVL